MSDREREMLAEVNKLVLELQQLKTERDQARANARILAHAYRHDSRPPEHVVEESLAYPVK